MSILQMVVIGIAAGVSDAVVARLLGRRRPSATGRPGLVERVHIIPVANVFPPSDDEVKRHAGGEVPAWMWASAKNN